MIGKSTCLSKKNDTSDKNRVGVTNYCTDNPTKTTDFYASIHYIAEGAHEYIHYVQTRKGYQPAGFIFPVSAIML